MFVRQLFFTSLMLASATAAFAQAPTPGAPAPPANVVDPRKPAVLSFETNLREAVDLAGQRMTERASQIAPVQIVQLRSAKVRGVPIEGFGYHFDVEIPAISGSGLAMLEIALKNQQLISPGMPWAPRQVSQNTDRAGATVVNADPVTSVPMVAPPVTEADLNQMYTTFVKDALIDAIVDTAGVLVLTDVDRLIVTASGDDVLRNQLERIKNRQLVLTMKGVDLNAWRSGRISRDQVRDRIEVKAF